MTGISQQFCVRWNSHLGSLGAAFPQVGHTHTSLPDHRILKQKPKSHLCFKIPF